MCTTATGSGSLTKPFALNGPICTIAGLTRPSWCDFPHGESLHDLVARASNVLRLVLEQHHLQTVVVVGHSSGNRALLLQTLDQPLSAYWRLAQDPCSLSEIEILEHGATVHRMNETYHLLEA